MIRVASPRLVDRVRVDRFRADRARVARETAAERDRGGPLGAAAVVDPTADRRSAGGDDDSLVLLGAEQRYLNARAERMVSAHAAEVGPEPESGPQVDPDRGVEHPVRPDRAQGADELDADRGEG